MPQLSADARNLNWLIGNFAKTTAGGAHTMVVSADGLPIAVSDRLERARADQLAATASCLASLSQGGARCLDGGLVKHTVVEMEPGVPVRHVDQRRLLPDRAGRLLLRRGRGRLPDGHAGHPRR
jgi:predicted regulator of Ras-like GTPase activity (Roadblock/LC7/MglB family)